MGLGLADRDRLVPGQVAAGEERRAADQDVAGPGEGEAALDQDLAAVGGGDRAGGAPEHQAAQGVAAVVLGGGGGRLGQGVEQPERGLGPRPGRLGEGGRADRGDGVLAGPGDAAVGPAGDGAVGGEGLQRDGGLVAALEVGQGLERQGDRAGRGPGRGDGVLDGQVRVPMSRA